MSAPVNPDSLPDPRDAAAYWFARVRSGRMDAAETQAFEAWRQADPAHAREYRRAEGMWNATALIPADRLRALRGDPQPDASLHMARRHLAFGVGLACATAVIGTIAWPVWQDGWADYSAEFSTQRGERSLAELPDGSVIELNTATRLTVRMSSSRRIVALQEGEASFTVTPDRERPFLVRAGETQVRVTGTRFNVRRNSEDVRVVVESGAVEVTQGRLWNRGVTQLVPGQLVRAIAGAGLSPAEPTDVASELAWRQGRVVFRNTPLSVAVSEMNRYLPQAIELDAKRVGAIRIAGMFSVDDPQSFLHLLPDIAPVQVVRRPEGGVLITGR